jgi:hypothetical protein
VIGSRVLGNAEEGALEPLQVLGNRIATRIIRVFYGHRYTDLGPRRAIRAAALRQLGMRDRNYGWTIEMQIRALRYRVSCGGVRYPTDGVSAQARFQATGGRASLRA